MDMIHLMIFKLKTVRAALMLLVALGLLISSDVFAYPGADTGAGAEIVLNLTVGDVMVQDMIDINASNISLICEEIFDLSDSDSSVAFSVSAYRGNTLKKTINVWLEDATGKRASLLSKFSLPDRFRDYDLAGEISFSKTYPLVKSGEYFLVASGLGLEYSVPVRIYSPADDADEGSADDPQDTAPNVAAGTVNSRTSHVSFRILSAKKTAYVNESFSTRVLASNPSAAYLEFDAWSYIYRGSRSVSGEREGNRRTMNLPAFSNITFDIENTAEEDGNFTLKVVILRQGLKTTEELKSPIIILPQQRYPSDGALSKSQNYSDPKIGEKNISVKSLDSLSSITGAAVSDSGSYFDPESGDIAYRSSSAKGKSLILYVLLMALVLIAVAVIIKKL